MIGLFSQSEELHNTALFESYGDILNCKPLEISKFSLMNSIPRESVKQTHRFVSEGIEEARTLGFQSETSTFIKIISFAECLVLEILELIHVTFNASP